MIPLTQKPFEKRLAIHLDCERQAVIWLHPAPGTCWRQWNHRVLAMLVWIEIPKECWLETLTFREVINNSVFFCWGNSHLFFSQSWVKPGLVKSQQCPTGNFEGFVHFSTSPGFPNPSNFSRGNFNISYGSSIVEVPFGWIHGGRCRIRLPQIQGVLKWKVITKTYLTNSEPLDWP